jgi:hypothetical protein
VRGEGTRRRGEGERRRELKERNEEATVYRVKWCAYWPPLRHTVTVTVTVKGFAILQCGFERRKRI